MVSTNSHYEATFKIKTPIVVGGIGGSGTRVVTKILKELNLYVGSDLNEELDNLSYTLLFKRRNWYYKNQRNKKTIFRGLSILQKSMLKSKPFFSFSECSYILNATLDMYLNGHNMLKSGTGKWALERYKNLINQRYKYNSNYIGWGWKEPNSHLLLPYLNDFFPDLKYIHVIRNGLDMAFSNNQQQLHNWSELYNILIPSDNEKLPETSFKYWMAANNKAIEYSKKMAPNKFLLVIFENLCSDPKNEIHKILDFLNIPYNESDLHDIFMIPKKPETSNRYLDKNISWITEEQKIFLKQFQYIK